jgi:hypothetical protein
MVNLQCPDGVSQVSVDGRNYQANDNGYVSVQDGSVSKLMEIGFRISPLSMTVSQEDFDVITANAKDLNLPVPGEVKVVGKQSARIKVE